VPSWDGRDPARGDDLRKTAVASCCGGGRELALRVAREIELPRQRRGGAPVGAKKVLEYFLRNPDALNDLEGVARWRLMDDRISRRAGGSDGVVVDVRKPRAKNALG
jgi:hypothetical protein